MIVYFLIDEDINGEIGQKIYPCMDEYIQDMQNYPFLKKYESEAYRYFMYSNIPLIVTNSKELILKERKEQDRWTKIFCVLQRIVDKNLVLSFLDNEVSMLSDNISEYMEKR